MSSKRNVFLQIQLHLSGRTQLGISRDRRGGDAQWRSRKAGYCSYIPWHRNVNHNKTKVGTSRKHKIMWTVLHKQMVSKRSSTTGTERGGWEGGRGWERNGAPGRCTLLLYTETAPRSMMRSRGESMERQSEDIMERGMGNRGLRIATWGGRQAHRRPKNNTLWNGERSACKARSKSGQWIIIIIIK